MAYVEFEEIDVIALPGVLVTGRAELGLTPGEWTIEDIQLTYFGHGPFQSISQTDLLGKLFFAAVSHALQSNTHFVNAADEALAEEYPERSDADEHGTYRVSGGRVVG